MSGPALVKSSLPILNAATTDASSSAKLDAFSAVGTSRATIIGLRMEGVKRNGALATSRESYASFFNGVYSQPVMFRKRDEGAECEKHKAADDSHQPGRRGVGFNGA